MSWLLFAAPMIGSCCIVSVLLSRFVVKEKLTRLQYLCVSIVILGIVLLGTSEGVATLQKVRFCGKMPFEKVRFCG